MRTKVTARLLNIITALSVLAQSQVCGEKDNAKQASKKRGRSVRTKQAHKTANAREERGITAGQLLAGYCYYTDNLTQTDVCVYAK